MDQKTYETLYAYMFGDHNVKEYEDELDDIEPFLDWIRTECDWQYDLPDLSWEEIEQYAAEVIESEKKIMQQEDCYE